MRVEKTHQMNLSNRFRPGSSIVKPTQKWPLQTTAVVDTSYIAFKGRTHIFITQEFPSWPPLDMINTFGCQELKSTASSFEILWIYLTEGPRSKHINSRYIDVLCSEIPQAATLLIYDWYEYSCPSMYSWSLASTVEKYLIQLVTTQLNSSGGHPIHEASAHTVQDNLVFLSVWSCW